MWWHHARGVLSQTACSRRLSLAAAIAGGGTWFWKDDFTLCDARTTFTAEEVSEHNGKTHPETWVSYQGKVYNITNFLKQHPGGDFIHDAAGGPLENYWAYWAYHLSLARPMEFLKQYEICLLDDDDEQESIESVAREMYETDPDRAHSVASGQVELLARPWCSETDPRMLATPFTPNDAFYVRNHAPVPIFDSSDADDYEVTIECNGKTPSCLTVASLKERFEWVTIHSILQCAGNRGGEMMQVAPTAFAGTPFENIQTGMMGNASWKGVRLADVLLDLYPDLAEIPPQEISTMHVEFEGVDGYKVSCPLSRVLKKSYDALLAMEMNDEPLPPDHGGPLRVLLPGIAGARNCKWVHSIRIIPEESTSCFQKTYYLDYYGRAIQEMPMQCFLISKELKGTAVCKIKGVAWGGGSGVGISKVQVSADDGETWKDATLKRIARDKSSNHREWAWVHFEAEFPVEDPKAPLPTVLSRAVDGDGLQQPEKIWYPKGYLSHGWHKL